MLHNRPGTHGHRALRWCAATLVCAIAIGSCFQSGDRYIEEPAATPNANCTVGALRCAFGLERCESTEGTTQWVVIDDCPAKDQVCAPSLLACANCIPDEEFCTGQDVQKCDPLGETSVYLETCDPSKKEACRAGACQNLCLVATLEKSNVGCEYWAVDLDNARIDDTSNAAAQQYAVVVSNPQPDVPVAIEIFRDDSSVDEPNAPLAVAQSVIAPLNLQVFKLGPREVDGSPEGEFDTGPGTAHTRAAYKIVSDFPVVAYQFNPLENVSVFSNDASLLKPREAVTYGGNAISLAYIVSSWPQTIAITDDPNTNFNAQNPIELRASLTLVGTQEETIVRVHPTARVGAGLGVPAVPIGGMLELTLNPFDVVNLETVDFLADFTGTRIEANGPVVVFTGGEASDAPHFDLLSQRRCCADHLEDQLVPIRTAGRKYAIAHTPSRTETISNAGAIVGIIPEPDFVRFVAVRESGARIKTSLPAPDDEIVLSGLGDWTEVTAYTDFIAESDEPVIVSQVMSSQDAAGIARGLPGGDPSLLMVPPLEQARPDYVFLTPDKYAFDFVSIVAPRNATVLLDDTQLAPELCEIAPADGLTEEQRGGALPEYLVYRCQLSFATVDPNQDPPVISPGTQNDGVHRVVSNFPINVTVTGFDAFVSYAYAAGTELREIAPPL